MLGLACWGQGQSKVWGGVGNRASALVGTFQQNKTSGFFLFFVFVFLNYTELNLNRQSLLRAGKPSAWSCFRAHSGACRVPGAGTEDRAWAQVYTAALLGF